MARLLSILLQRSDPAVPWGFSIAGGPHLAISQVNPGSVGGQYLSPGDIVLQFDGRDTATLLVQDAEKIMARPSKSLELLVQKGPARRQSLGASDAPAVSWRTRGGRRMSDEGSTLTPSWRHMNGDMGPMEVPKTKTRNDVNRYERNGPHHFQRSTSYQNGSYRSDELDSVIRRQSSQVSGGGSPVTTPGSAGSGETGSVPAPPPFPTTAPPAPPPPPPPGPGILPAVRLNTEIPDTRGQRGNTYEPPAAIQNAMMTKDKKPFTYTPGGLDLSQIRSPRMQRRITRNAASEGVPEQPAAPKPSPLAQPPPPAAVAAMQPQIAVPVFPTGGMTPPTPPTPPTQPAAPIPPPQPKIVSPPPQPKVVSPPPPQPKIASPPPQPQLYRQPEPAQVKVQNTVGPPSANEPGSIYVPPVTGARAQLGSIYIPPVTAQQEVSPSPQRQTPQSGGSPASPIAVSLNKAPTPWLTNRPQQTQPQAPWTNREELQATKVIPVQITKEETSPSSRTVIQQQAEQPGTRIIPIQIEGREPPQNQQQQRNTQSSPSVQQNRGAYNVSAPTSQPSNTRIIPIQIEGAPSPSPAQSQQQQQQQMQQRKPVYVHNKFNPTTPTTPITPGEMPVDPRQLQHQQSWGSSGPSSAPIQSRSFRVLQKITDTDNLEDDQQPSQPVDYPYGNQSTQGVPVQQLRKLQLNDDDRALMDRFKAQVDEDSFLHNEPDPRYRGAAIPSRAFRMLQSMTDGAGGPEYDQTQVPRGPGMARGPQSRPVSTAQPATESPPQPYIPPSEQQVQEPRKYVGGSIPSRSFKILQAMTAPENCGPGQSDM